MKQALTPLYTLLAPNGKHAIRLFTLGSQLYYTLRTKERQILEPTLISLSLSTPEGVLLTPDLSQPEITPFTRDLTAALPLYTKRSRIALTANGVTLAQGGFKLTLLASSQGIAFRWETAFDFPVTVNTESFALEPSGSPELLYAYNNTPYQGDLFQNSWESIHNKGPLTDIDPSRLIYLPVTLRYPMATLAVCEAELRDYPGLNLRRPSADAARLTGSFARFPLTEEKGPRYCRVTSRTDYLVRAAGTRTYPWRVFIIGETLADLYNSDWIEALSTPADGDYSWVKPGKVAWEWWNHWGLEETTFTPGVNTATYKAYIDFASEYAIPYVILDEGWAKDLDVMQIIPEIDLPEILRHAKQKGVGIVLWSSWPQLIERQEALFSHYAKLGVVGFKIDFMDRDDATIARFLYTTARIAAKYKLIIAYHGIHKPTGLTRTYPNVLTYEGVYGLEQTKWTGNDVDFITNDIRLAFGRLLAGPMDFTPGAMRNATRENFRADNCRPMSMGTRCRQAALFLLYDTNFQMLCDSPSAYQREPAYTQLLAAVPLNWDDTLCDPVSEPDDLLVVKRTKGNETWYAGIVGNATRVVTLSLDGLGDGSHRATLLQDALNADYDPTAYTLKEITVSAGERLTIPCAPGGGFLIRIISPEM